jgi:hypothetical protein
MARFNFSAVSKLASSHNSISWGKLNIIKKNLEATTGALLFAALLILCSVSVGCSGDKPKAVASNTQTPIVPSTMPMTTSDLPSVPVRTATAKPAAKKIVHRRPATLTFADKTSGVSFQYPRRYDLKTGDDAGKLVSSIPLPMNFIQPGGVALAAVELPESIYNGNDLAAAFFNVSVNRNLTAEQCEEFLAPQPQAVQPTQTATPSDSSAANVAANTSATIMAPATAASTAPAAAPTDSATVNTTAANSAVTPVSAAAPAENSVEAAAQTSKLILGDMEMQGTEAITGEGIRQTDAKYFHVFQNGACYEFAVNVTTAAPESQLAMKHVDREKAFQQLEKILATVRVETVAAPEVAATSPAAPANTQPTPAQ